MGRALVLVAADGTLRMVPCVLDSLYDSRFVCLIVFGKLRHAFVGSFAIRGQALRISGLPSAPRVYLL
jgi:hypothetical protein